MSNGFSFGNINASSKKHVLKLDIIQNSVLLDRSNAFASYDFLPVILVDERYEDIPIKAIEEFLKNLGIPKFLLLSVLNCSIQKNSIKAEQKEGIISFYMNNCSDFEKHIPKGAPIITSGAALYSLLKEDDIYPNHVQQIIFGKSCFLFSKDLTSENCHMVYPIESFRDIFAKGFKKPVDSYKTKLAQIQLNKVLKYGGKPIPRYPKLKKIFITSKEEFNEIFYEPNKDKRAYVAWDLETGGFNFLKDRIGCITLSFDGITGYYIPWKYVDKDKLREILKNNKQILANGKFDCKFLWANGIPEARIDEDVITLGHVLDETRSNSLKALAFYYSEFGGYERPLDIYKKRVKVDSYLDIDEDILKEYAIMDAIVTYRIWVNMMKHVRELDKKYPNEHGINTGLESYYYTRRIPANNLYAGIEYRGIYVDKDRLDNLRIEMQDYINSLKAQLAEAFGVSVDFDWGSSAKLGRLLEKKGWEELGRNESGEYQVSEFQIKRWSKDHPEAKLLKELKSMNVMINAFVGDVKGTKGWSQYLTYHPEDDSWRMHPDYFPMGTDSGRTRCQKPNMQNTPTRGKYAKAIKRCLKTPNDNDYYMVTVDYSSLQMRLATIDSKDKHLTEVFNRDNADVHSLTGWLVFAKEKTFDVMTVEVEQDGKTYKFLGGQQVMTQRGYVLARDLQEDDEIKV